MSLRTEIRQARAVSAGASLAGGVLIGAAFGWHHGVFAACVALAVGQALASVVHWLLQRRDD